MIKWAFLIGNIGYICTLRVTGMWLMPYISPASQPYLFFKDLTLIGLALALSQILNAFIDPFLGRYISQIKRRFLFQIFSVITFSIFSLVPFNPIYNQGTDIGNLIILLGLLIINLLCCSLFQTSFLSLLPVLAKSDHDRSLYSTYVTFGMIIGGALSLGMSGFAVNLLGIKNTITLFLIIGFIFMMISTFLLPFKEVGQSEKTHQSLLKDFGLVFNNTFFLISLLCMLAANSVYTFFTFIAPYITEVIIKKPHSYTSYAIGISVLFAAVCTPLASKMIKVIGALKWMFYSFFFFMISLILIGLLGVFSDIRLLLSLYLGSCILCGIGVGQTLVLTYVLIAKSVDKEPAGKSTAPIYHAFYNLFLKVTTGAIAFLISLLFEHLGSNFERSLGIKLSFLIPFIFVGVTLLFLFIKRNDHQLST